MIRMQIDRDVDVLMRKTSFLSVPRSQMMEILGACKNSKIDINCI